MSGHATLAEVAKAVPSGTLCLLSALAFQLGTQQPHEVWLAIAGTARAPRRAPVKLFIIRMSGRPLTSGIETGKESTAYHQDLQRGQDCRRLFQVQEQDRAGRVRP